MNWRQLDFSMSKRLQLLKAVYSYNMERLRDMKSNDPNFWPLSGEIKRLHKRIKPKNKVKVVQESMFRDYTVEYKKGKATKNKVVQASSKNSAEFIIKKKFGEKTQILSIQ